MRGPGAVDPLFDFSIARFEGHRVTVLAQTGPDLRAIEPALRNEQSREPSNIISSLQHDIVRSPLRP